MITIDADSNPNLASALGITQVLPSGKSLPVGLVSKRFGGPSLGQGITEVLESYATTGPDGLKLIVMGAPGHAEEGCLCASYTVVSALLCDLGEDKDQTVIVDLEASPEHLSRGTARHVDVLILVAEPYYRSLEAVRLMAELASELPIPEITVVFNKVRSPQDSMAMEEYCLSHGLSSLGEVPWSDDIREADGEAVSLFDRAPDSAAVRAISHLADRLWSSTHPLPQEGAGSR